MGKYINQIILIEVCAVAQQKWLWQRIHKKSLGALRIFKVLTPWIVHLLHILKWNICIHLEKTFEFQVSEMVPLFQFDICLLVKIVQKIIKAFMFFFSFLSTSVSIWFR